MSTYVFARNGMGNYTTGTGMREDMLMQAFNIMNYQAGVVLSGDLVVTQRAAGANMSVDVAKGRCFVLNSSYVANTANSTKYWGMLSDAVTNLAISTNTAGSTRYDLIIAKIDTVPSPNDYATNVGTIEVVQGVAGSGQPATPSNSLLLAVLEIPDGTTTQIVNADITDSRVRAHLSLDDSLLSNNAFLKWLDTGGVERNIIGVDGSDDVLLKDVDGNTFIQLDESTGNAHVIPKANGDALVLNRHPRDNDGSATYQNAHIQSGWGYIRGDGTTAMEKTITLPIAYSSELYRVQVTCLGGGLWSSPPASEGDLANIGAIVGTVCTYYVIDATQFEVQIWRSAAFPTSEFAAFSWIAVGPA